MREKDIILAARVISLIFTPFYLPFVGLIGLFLFSYLNAYHLKFKIEVLVMVYLFTILLPTILIISIANTKAGTSLSWESRKDVWCLISSASCAISPATISWGS